MQPSDVDTGGGAFVSGGVTAQTFVGRDQIVNHFTGRYARLRDLYRSPDHIYADVDVANFVGRENIKRAIDAFLRDNDSGAFIIEGEAGLGKTALMAHLAYSRGYPHLFGQDFSGVDGRVEAARSLAAQLISKYELEGYGEFIDADQAASATFLTHVFNQAARGLKEGERIVVVVDALDQAAPPADGRNAFGLPSRLPRGAYLIVTQRPVRTAFECEPSEVFALAAGDADNQRDLRAFLSQHARRPAIAAQLAGREPPYAAGAFVEALLEKSGGNWMYLRYVLGEIERGNLRPLDLDALPRGLTQYYLSYWRGWADGRLGEGPAAWRALYRPLLGLLAAAQAPLRAEALRAWGALAADEDVIRQLLTVDWAAFVRHLPDDAFQFFHPSLTRLVRGEAEPGELHGLRNEARELVAGFARATADAHGRIAEYFRARCGGEWAGLADDPYARRFLAAHLAGAGDAAGLYGLISPAWWRARRERDPNAYAGFLADATLARAVAEREVHAGGNAEAVAEVLRLGLIVASLRAVTQQLPPRLLARAVAEGEIEPAAALDLAAQLPQPGERAEACRAVLGAAPLAPALAEQAAAVLARAEAERAEQGDRPMALLAPDEIRAALPPADRAAIAAALEAVLAEFQPGAASEAQLFARMPSGAPARALRRAVDAAFGYDGALARRQPATRGWLTPPLRPVLLHDELWEYALARAMALTFDAEFAARRMPEAMAALEAVRREETRAEIVAALAPFGAAPWTEALLAAALKLQKPAGRWAALDGLAPHLSGEPLRRALEATRALRDDLAERFAALCALAPHLSAEARREALELAVDALPALPGSVACPRVAALAPLLPADLRERAVGEALSSAPRLAQDVHWAGVQQARSLNQLEPALAGESRASAAILARWILTRLRDMEEPPLVQAALVLLSPFLDSAELAAGSWYAAGAAREIMARAAAEPDAAAAAGLREAALLALIPEIKVDVFVAMALVALAPRLSDAGLAPAVELAASLTRYTAGARDALVALAPRLRGPALERAIAVADALDDDLLRHTARIALAARQEPGAMRAVLDAALAYAEQARDPYYRGGAMAALAAADARWRRERAGRLRPLLTDLLRAAAERGRGRYCEQVAALAPLIFALHPAAADPVGRALIDAGWRWEWL